MNMSMTMAHERAQQGAMTTRCSDQPHQARRTPGRDAVQPCAVICEWRVQCECSVSVSAMAVSLKLNVAAVRAQEITSHQDEIEALFDSVTLALTLPPLSSP